MGNQTKHVSVHSKINNAMMMSLSMEVPGQACARHVSSRVASDVKRTDPGDAGTKDDEVGSVTTKSPPEEDTLSLLSSSAAPLAYSAALFLDKAGMFAFPLDNSDNALVELAICLSDEFLKQMRLGAVFLEAVKLDARAEEKY